MSSSDEKYPRLSSLKNVKWVAHYLGVSRNTIHQWVLEGHIPYINLGVTGGRRIIRFDPAAIEEWLVKRSYIPDQAQSPTLQGKEEIETEETDPESDDDSEDDHD